MSYNAYITRIKNLRKHCNADRLQVGEVFGNSVIVSLNTNENDLGIYFPTDMRLGMEYCEANNLLRKKDENGNNIGGYLEPEKRHITTINLRNEKSDGLFMPLLSLSSFTDISKLKEGDIITTLNDVLICEKYIPKRNISNRKQFSQNNNKYKTKIIKKELFPLFQEHIDTSQLAYNLNKFKEGDICYITLKLHGTSGRTSRTIRESKTILPYWLFKICQTFNINLKPKKNWSYISGTRRTILKTYDSGYYGNDEFRKKWHDFFIGKLKKGECAYYEIVGWVNNDTTIMPTCNNKKLKDKEFIKKYDETTTFSYGCNPGENNIYVYRMTMTNEDGDVVEYPTELTKLRCEQMGVNFVPILDKFIFTTTDDLMMRVNKFVDGEDPIGKTHIKEGVVVKIENREKFSALKHKSFEFKVLESIIKTDAIKPDIEEEQDLS